MTSAPLDYVSKLTKPKVRWCLPAVLGFALSAPGPILGFSLAWMLGSLDAQFPVSLIIAFICGPTLLGLVLSLNGLRITSRAIPKQRGESLAAAGIACCGLWVMPIIFFGLLSLLQ